MFFQHLQTLSHKHGVLAARDTDADLVTGLYEFVFLDGFMQFRPYRFAVLLNDNVFNIHI